MKIGLKYFTCPGAFVQYKGIPGVTGKVLGIWSVLMQVITIHYFTER
jgi:amino acid transporter